MLTYPHIDPVIVQLGPVAIHWYGLMYLLGFGLAYWLGNRRAAQSQGQWNTDQVSDLIFYGALGVVIGGRIGYMFFYDLPTLIQNPLSLFKVWDGGMSFHGGLIGVSVSLFFYCRSIGKPWFEVMDFVAPLVPLGLAAGRLGNFINGELWGRVSDVPWAMVYPNGGLLPRHPSELYEFFCEGILLFIVLWCFSAKPRPRKAVSGLFLVGYAVARVFCETFRVPDPQYGYLAFGWVTMGQILSLPMLLAGLYLLRLAYKKS